MATKKRSRITSADIVRKVRDKIDSFGELEKYLSIQSRTVSIRGEITDESIGEVIDRLNMFEDLNKNPVNIHISSYGGDAYATLQLVEYFRNMNSSVSTLVQGYAFSSAAITAFCGTKGLRTAYKNSRLMLHEVAHDPGYAKTTDHKLEVAEMEWLEDVFAGIIAGNSEIDYGFVKELISSKDRYFSTAEALEWGLIDNIL